MHSKTNTQRAQWLARLLLFANPYEPPIASGPSVDDSDRDSTFITSLRLDWLTVAALAATLLSSFAIYLYHTAGTGVIGDPILLSLASHSIVWIPIYRMAMPLLILLMPDRCRHTFAVFFLVLGILCSLNDLGGHYLDIYLVTYFFNDVSTGLLAGIAICFVLAFGQFTIDAIHATNRKRMVVYTLGWFGILLLIQTLFLGLSLIV